MLHLESTGTFSQMGRLVPIANGRIARAGSLTYGSWSMAQGIRHGMSCFSPKIWGNELEKEGAA